MLEGCILVGGLQQAYRQPTPHAHGRPGFGETGEVPVDVLEPSRTERQLLRFNATELEVPGFFRRLGFVGQQVTGART